MFGVIYHECIIFCSSRIETPTDKTMSPQNSRPISAPGEDAPSPASAEKNEVVHKSFNQTRILNFRICSISGCFGIRDTTCSSSLA